VAQECVVLNMRVDLGRQLSAWHNILFLGNDSLCLVRYWSDFQMHEWSIAEAGNRVMATGFYPVSTDGFKTADNFRS